MSSLQRVPFVYMTITPGGGNATRNKKLLLVGYANATNKPATTLDNELYLINNDEDVLFGRSSQLSRMVKKARLNAPAQTIYAVCLAPPTGVAAFETATIANVVSTFTAVGGQFPIYIDMMGTRVTALVSSTSTDTSVAADLVSDINRLAYNVSLPVIATAAAGIITIALTFKGVEGNDARLALNAVGDEGSYSSQIITFGNAADPGKFTSGAGFGDISDIKASMSDDEYDTIFCSVADITTLNVMEDLLSPISGRWSPLSQLYGQSFFPKDGSAGTLTAFGEARNDPHASLFGFYKWRSPSWEAGAAVAAVVAAHTQTYPKGSTPIQNVKLIGIYGPVLKSDRFDKTTREGLLFSGISTFAFDDEGRPMIERLITTYRKNIYGTNDDTFLNVENMYQNVEVSRRFRAAVERAFPQASLGDDPNPSKLVATPLKVADVLVHEYKAMAKDNIVENAGLFERSLVVERDPNNPDKLRATLPIDLMNQFRIFDGEVISYLQRQAIAQ